MFQLPVPPIAPAFTFSIVLLGGSIAQGQEAEQSPEEIKPPVAEAPASPPKSGPRWLTFSAEEIARYRTIAAEREQQRESYIRASEDDEVVVLEPYIVEGDSSLVIARLRRQLEETFGARSQLPEPVDPSVQRELALTRRSNDEFFNGPSPGAPADHVRSGIDLIGGGADLINAIRNRRLGDLFRAPKDGAAP